MPHRKTKPKHILGLLQETHAGPVPSINWPSVLSVAFAEHLQGLLYQNAARLAAPAPVVRTLQNAYYHQVTANLVRIRALDSLEAALTGSGIEVMVLKGAALLDSVYADPGLRPMEDIDLLIRPADREPFERLLTACGYNPDPVFSHLFCRNGVTFDLHSHPLNVDRVAGRHHLFPGGADALWRDSVSWRSGFRHIRRPDAADHLILLTHHMIKHSVSKMIWLVDIHRLLKNRDPLFFCRLNRKISAWHQERPVAFMIYLLYSLFGEKPSGIWIGTDPEKLLSRFERAVLDIRIRGCGIGDLGNILWLRCLPDHGNAFRFAIETLFPPEKVLMREQCRNTASSRGGAYFYRSGEIIRRVLSSLMLLARGGGKGVGFPLQ